jgi:3-carboxy-cis,cis-muconate cycloisomerase
MNDPRTALWSTPEMVGIFSAEAHLAAILRFEAALARAEARAEIIPAAAADAIAAACRVDRFDVVQVFREAAIAGTVVIPLVKALTEQVAEAGKDWVHWGATSQDAIDTALMLQMRDSLALLISGLHAIGAECATQAERYRATLMAGRTLLQQAVPITFGLKAARWLALTTRQIEALRAVQTEAPALQFGGAAGTLAALGPDGLLVAEWLAADLHLPLPDLPWHAERDRVARIAAVVGISAGAMAKIATDLVLLAQTEVGEIAEVAPPGKGGSSAMPQKQNPVDAVFALAAARQAGSLVGAILGGMAHEHERAVGGWQAEWAALPDLFCFTAGAVERVRSALGGLRVNETRLHDNIVSSGELIMAESLTTALARQIGKPAAEQGPTATPPFGPSLTWRRSSERSIRRSIAVQPMSGSTGRLPPTARCRKPDEHDPHR